MSNTTLKSMLKYGLIVIAAIASFSISKYSVKSQPLPTTPDESDSLLFINQPEDPPPPDEIYNIAQVEEQYWATRYPTENIPGPTYPHGTIIVKYDDQAHSGLCFSFSASGWGPIPTVIDCDAMWSTNAPQPELPEPQANAHLSQYELNEARAFIAGLQFNRYEEGSLTYCVAFSTYRSNYTVIELPCKQVKETVYNQE